MPVFLMGNYQEMCVLYIRYFNIRHLLSNASVFNGELPTDVCVVHKILQYKTPINNASVFNGELPTDVCVVKNKILMWHIYPPWRNG